MKLDPARKYIGVVLATLVLVLVSPAGAQTGTGSLHGTVTDPSGAAVTNATVIAVTPDGSAKTSNTNRTGAYTIDGLAPGTYTATVSVP